MSSSKVPSVHGRTALATLSIGVVGILLWPVVTAIFVLSAWDVGETCARVHSSGDLVRYDFFPPRMLCSTGTNEWASATPAGVTVGFSVVLVLGVAAMVVGVVAGVRAVPTLAPVALGVNFVYVAGTVPSLSVRRLRRLCGLLAVASVLSPAWMLYLGFGVGQAGSGAPDPYTQIPIYAAQLVVAGAIPLLAVAAGLAGWVLRARARSGRADRASVAVAGLVAGTMLLALTLSLGLGAIAKVITVGERFVPATTGSAQITAPPSAGDVQLMLPPELPPVVLPDAPSTALTATELEAQFAAFVAQTSARFGPAFAEPERQGAVPGPALDLAVAAAPYAFDCLNTGIGYGMELTFSSAAVDDWDVNYDAAAAAFLRITAGWAADGYPSQTYNSEFLAYADEPSLVSQLRARHVGSTVRVGMQSLCVAR
ncbi:hypothetical protein E3O25_04005 [Cryobacterium sp. TMT1-3]|uniref:hypothetical protein n=1 Tax=Cryobacterium sp. TMT1-3 TaxID=1259237 RepID=UPI00106B8B93|nr:hypothetical protein [Cryobacterium sp. TMT1-3]TFC29932.1 hypothetical protein E3O25_04005 [Cryobacterium sp. TMT1-3]